MIHPPNGLDQEVLRRRLRAARILADVTVEQLADMVTPGSRLSQRTLHKLEQGDTPLTPPIMKELADALDLPETWFTVPSIGDALAPAESTRAQLSELRDADEALKADLARLWEIVSARPAGTEGRGQTTQPPASSPPPPSGKPRSPRRSSRP